MKAAANVRIIPAKQQVVDGRPSSSGLMLLHTAV